MNMKKIQKLLFAALLVMLTFSPGVLTQPVWVTQNPLPQCNTINDVQFIGISTGYEAGNYGTIFKTTNAGANWISQASGTTENLNSISFINVSTGYIAGGLNNRVVLKTTNGGANWLLLNTGGGSGFLAIGFSDANTGFAGGYGGLFMRTTNGGANWNTLTFAAVSLHSIFICTP